MERRVLLAHGEAFFEVEPSDDRPFVVATEFGYVRVTGTAFLVRLEDTGLEVVVKEGRVELHEQGVDNSGGTLVADLEAGEVAIVDQSGSALIDEIGPEKMVRKLGWRDGMLMFDGESLDEVVREVSRYTSVNIVIETPALREQRIGGYFKVGEVEDLLGTLESDFDIEVHRVDDNNIRLAAQYN
jgi:transmembrane sensor